MAQTPWLTLDTVVATPRPGATTPAQLAFSPDGRLLTYVWSERGDAVRDLWAFEVASGERRLLVQADDLGPREEPLNTEEALRRERLRVRDSGITQYAWAKTADRLLIPFNGQLYVSDSSGRPPLHVAPAHEAAVDSCLTADGEWVVFARAGELWTASVETGTLTQLTFDAEGAVTNGVADFIAQEEMGRSNGFWVSPHGTRVAFVQVDAGPVPVYPILHQAGDDWRVEEHPYPFAGEANVRVRLGVVPMIGSAPEWLDLGPDEDIYLARVDWYRDSSLLVQVESRDQQRLELRLYDLETGGWRVLLTEQGHPWINLHHDLRVLEDGRIIWASERTEFKHLYLLGPDGSEIRPLTAGRWPVDAVVHVDETRGLVFYTAGRQDPRQRHLYAASLSGERPRTLHMERGFHGAVFATDGSHYAHSFESTATPPRVDMVTPESAAGAAVHSAEVPGYIRGELAPPTSVELTAADGTRLYGAVYTPGGGQGPWPTIVSVYGGPHAQMVTDTWGMTIDLRAQYLASLGFLVFKLDNRGSGRRGLSFEAALHRRMGIVEVEDQVAGVAWLVDQGMTDPARVGIYGWSYGGFLSAMCLLKAPETFKAAVAGAPVAHWSGYDTHYTERYMSTPALNPEGYRDGALTTHVESLRGKLLIIHGLVDENVHFRHSARLIAALEHAGKPFDLLLLPEERHSVRPTLQNLPVRRMLEERLATFFQQNL